jgi:hypothetical protein
LNGNPGDRRVIFFDFEVPFWFPPRSVVVANLLLKLAQPFVLVDIRISDFLIFFFFFQTFQVMLAATQHECVFFGEACDALNEAVSLAQERRATDCILYALRSANFHCDAALLVIFHSTWGFFFDQRFIVSCSFRWKLTLLEQQSRATAMGVRVKPGGGDNSATGGKGRGTGGGGPGNHIAGAGGGAGGNNTDHIGSIDVAYYLGQAREMMLFGSQNHSLANPRDILQVTERKVFCKSCFC